MTAKPNLLFIMSDQHAPRVTEFTKRFTMRDADETAAERLSKIA